MLNRTTTPPSNGPMAPSDAARAGSAVRARFLALIQSPLRAGLLRFLAARPYDTFDVESLMETWDASPRRLEHLTGRPPGWSDRAHPVRVPAARPPNSPGC
jgi:hypothetical protein